MKDPTAHGCCPPAGNAAQCGQCELAARVQFAHRVLEPAWDAAPRKNTGMGLTLSCRDAANPDAAHAFYKLQIGNNML